MNILILARMSTGFSGNTVYEKPMGGSESALFYLSRELARLGHKVVIYNNCGDKAGTYEGVDYRPFTTLADLVRHSRENEYDIFVSFRDLPAFLFPIKAEKRVWWGHDDFSNVWNLSGYKKYLGAAFLRFAGFLINRTCDMLFVVSGWLGDICVEKVHVKRKKIYATKNGIHLPYFEPSPVSHLPSARNWSRLVYISVPARGLDVLLDMFPAIKKEVPEAELHVYCGFNLGVLKDEDRIKAERIFEKTKQPGVVLEGTRKHSELAKELMVSGLFLYPSHEVPDAAFFAETSCIAALEAQAAGCPVVASKRGALPESIQDGKTGILIDGDPFTKDFGDRFIKETVALLKDRKRHEEYSANAMKFIRENYTWELIAKEWTAKFAEMLK